MICEKCGKYIDSFMVNCFNYDGSDGWYKHPVEEYDTEAVAFETDNAWTGYELTEEEMMETISCPHCREFPFKHEEVQVYNIVRVVSFKS